MLQTVRRIRILDRDQVIENIRTLREEWEQHCDEASLVKVKASVGWLLIDLVQAIGLNSDEQATILGTELLKEIN